MRTPFRELAILLAIAAAAPAWAQSAPRVIFCKGECFFVGGDAILRAAPKGTWIPAGTHFETGPDSYAQLSVGPGVAVAVSEGARLRFDQTSLPGRNVIILNGGRIRILEGGVPVTPAARPLELRTTDGIFTLAGADVEVNKTSEAAATGPAMTFMKVNAGDARLVNGQSDVPIPKQGVQGVIAGKVVADKTFSLAEVVPPSPRSTGKPAPTAPVADVREPAVPPRFATQVVTVPTSRADSEVPAVNALNLSTGVSFGTYSQLRPTVGSGNQGAGLRSNQVTGTEFINSVTFEDAATGQQARLGQILGSRNATAAGTPAAAVPAQRKFTVLPNPQFRFQSQAVGK